jgi:hypothetical protein
MHGAVVLDIGVGPNPDGVHVSPEHGAIPDAGAIADFHIADDDRGRRDEDVLPDFWYLAVQGDDHDPSIHPKCHPKAMALRGNLWQKGAEVSIDRVLDYPGI